MPEVIDACARESYWTKAGDGWQTNRPAQDDNPAIRRGVGFACGFKNIGYSFGFPEQNWATVELYGRDQIEQVIVRQGGS